MVIMNGFIRQRSLSQLGFLAVLLLSTISLKANPITDGENSLFQFGTLSCITIAILMEAFCVVWLLRRRRTPRLFILWLMGMHLLTYPVFLGLLWLAEGVRPALAVATGEGLIVLIEGSLIYLMCRFLSSHKSELAVPSISRSLFASLVGNICSAVAFPLLMILYSRIAFSIEAAISH
jgi:hypothetical protein